MKYLNNTPFTVPVSNGKLTQADWERMVGPKPGTRIQTAVKAPVTNRKKVLDKVTR
jgi:hypothetical protein